jgi:hypothetical protein
VASEAKCGLLRRPIDNFSACDQDSSTRLEREDYAEKVPWKRVILIRVEIEKGIFNKLLLPEESLQGRSHGGRPIAGFSLLLCKRDVITPVGLPALFIFGAAVRLFFAVADRLDPVGADALCLQRFLH